MLYHIHPINMHLKNQNNSRISSEDNTEKKRVLLRDRSILLVWHDLLFLPTVISASGASLDILYKFKHGLTMPENTHLMKSYSFFPFWAFRLHAKNQNDVPLSRDILSKLPSLFLQIFLYNFFFHSLKIVYFFRFNFYS